MELEEKSSYQLYSDYDSEDDLIKASKEITEIPKPKSNSKLTRNRILFKAHRFLLYKIH